MSFSSFIKFATHALEAFAYLELVLAGLAENAVDACNEQTTGSKSMYVQTHQMKEEEEEEEEE